MDALISIKGTVLSEGAQPDIIELVTAGRYCTRDGKRYISYKESEMTGLDGVTTTLKVEGDDCVTLIRSGAAQSRLIIAKGQRQLCHYGTDYGDLMVGISGCHINSKLDDVGGELSFNYTLDVNSDTVSQNEVLISVREAKTGNVKSDKYSCQ
jgi:uncharacterized beta-barrel protein YwiB (DUF1934 family)